MSELAGTISPDFFDGCALDPQFSGFSPWQEEQLHRLESLWEVGAGESVLEVGCGAGRLTERLAAAVGFTGKVRACDHSPEMVARSKARGLPAQVEVVCESALAVGAPSGVFDKVLCLNSFHFFATPEAVAELARVLRPGGKLWISHFDDRESLNAHFEKKGRGFESFRLPEVHVLSRMGEGANLSLRRASDGSDGCWFELKKGLLC